MRHPALCAVAVAVLAALLAAGLLDDVLAGLLGLPVTTPNAAALTPPPR